MDTRTAAEPRGVVATETADVLRRVTALATPAGADADAVSSAVARAETVAQALGPAEATARVAATTLAVELAVTAAADADADATAVGRFVDAAADAIGVERQFLRRTVIAAASAADAIRHLPPRLAADAQLRTLVALDAAAEASLWANGPTGIECLVHVGAEAPTRAVRTAAAELARAGKTSARSPLVGVALAGPGERVGALVLRARGRRRDEALAVARAVAGSLTALVEHERLLARNEGHERSLVEATERRLVRLGLDLHDRPLQDLAALVAETRLLRSQLEQAQSLDAHRRLVIGRLDDFEARVLAIESDLRTLVQSADSGALGDTPFFELVRRQVLHHEGAGLAVSFETRGTAEGLTHSQRIALLRVIDEALANVTEHSGASHAHVRLSLGRANLRAEIIDDGRGFDVERTLAEAARTERLGLVGMIERIRLLGGRLDVRGDAGSTTLKVTIPRWRPPDATPTAAG